ncbi:hypothetical protein PC129_g17903 [Phytophthora cactorum]|uniref:Uncharacterized protein n=1 Tax=Phytophthora cactorum TaxID=29920 RepID=A0A8T1C878_9STRA|nr:hypothetical protein Pcac1_g15087 [Phytophthora cactorum]KAG2820232.1 hypothetical protein PC112_g11843 [Phytophthora cactorum]KAG2821152.1 hypothetical protein PC111_g11144 [Phytophthora cactorum]KAG2856948.1 hypothetical protein PC113_g11120 [Phytophthora cactorum]KAG2907162.1 hypothetical protein PC114_g10913 [Phytophthora cactorum]
MSETQLSDQYLYQSSLKSDPEIKVSSGKCVQFVIDLNQGSYQNGVITIDATAQLNGSEGFASLRDAYIMLPYKVSMKNGSTVLTTAANRFCATLKCGNWNVIDSMSLVLNGKTIVSMADYKLFWNNIRAQTGYSPQYVEKHGAETFLYPDAAQSVSYSSGTNSLTGDGYTNTAAFSSLFSTSAPPGGATVANDGLVKRLLSNPPTAGADFTSSWPSIGGTVASTTIANQTARGAFVAGAATANAIMGTWNYMLKIKPVDLHPIFMELDLMANPQIHLRFRVNQGSSVVVVDSTKGMSLTSTTLASGNVCPVMVAASSTGNPMAGVLAASAGFSIAWSAVVNSLEPTIDGTYMPFTTARLYVPFVHLENPQAIILKPVKKVRFNDCYAQLFYQRAGIGKQSTQLNTAFDLQLSASVKNAKYVVLLPFAEQTGSFASAAVQEFQSPFDSAPWTLQPGSSIRNFNVRIGSTQCFDISHDYDFHHFANEIAKIGAINGDLTPELVNGLLDYQTWSLTNRVLIADVSRLTEKDVPQAIQIQGVNAGSQGVNILVLVDSEQELSYDRLTGEVLDFTTA